MNDKVDNKINQDTLNPKNYVELAEWQFFEKVQKDLKTIYENLNDKKTTIIEAKNELNKVNEWLQKSNIEKKDKVEIWKAFEKLSNLEKNIDEYSLQKEVNEVVKLLETFTNRELTKLKYNIRQNPARPFEVLKWLEKSKKNLATTVENATKDNNPIARWIGELMKRLIA